MADEKEPEKTLEMRVAQLEDKLKGLQITPDEMRAFNKVAAMLAQGQAATVGTGTEAALTPAPDSCVIQQCIRACTVVQQCTIRACTIRACTVIQACTVVQQCTIRACTIIQDCINECGGGCAPGGPILTGGGFGTLGG